MSVLAALAKAEAVRAGRAQATAAVRHIHLAERPLVAVPLRLAGEAAAPVADTQPALLLSHPVRPL